MNGRTSGTIDLAAVDSSGWRGAWFQSRDWQREIRYMEAIGKKLELEALSNKHFSFITEEYLPKKLKDKRWLD